MKELIEKAFFSDKELLRKAMQSGDEAVLQLLKASAYSLGSQLGVLADLERLDEGISEILSMFNEGLKKAVMLRHGVKLDAHVEIYKMKRS